MFCLSPNIFLLIYLKISTHRLVFDISFSAVCHPTVLEIFSSCLSVVCPPIILRYSSMCCMTSGSPCDICLCCQLRYQSSPCTDGSWMFVNSLFLLNCRSIFEYQKKERYDIWDSEDCLHFVLVTFYSLLHVINLILCYSFLSCVWPNCFDDISAVQFPQTVLRYSILCCWFITWYIFNYLLQWLSC